MSETLDKAVAVKETSWVRRVSARALLRFAGSLRKAAHRLAGPPEDGARLAPVSEVQPLARPFTPDRVMWGFIAKDLYFSRIILLGGFITAAAGLATQRAGAGFVAAILLFCAVAAPAAFLVIFLIYGERQERSHLFDLSLPISPTRYLLGKVLAVTAAFGLIWLPLIAGLGLLIALSPGGAGYLPFFTVVWFFVLAEYCVLLWILVASPSAPAMIFGTILFNTSPSIFFYYAGRVVDSSHGSWSPVVLRLVAKELVISAVFFALTLWCVFRRRDPI